MPELIPIEAGYATPGQGAGPMLITQRAGLFEKHGLAVEPTDKRTARAVVAGLMAGELQFGNLAAPSMLRMVLQGEADVVFLALGINQQFLASRPGITDLKTSPARGSPSPETARSSTSSPCICRRPSSETGSRSVL